MNNIEIQTENKERIFGTVKSILKINCNISKTNNKKGGFL